MRCRKLGTIYVQSHLGNGQSVLVDSADNTSFLIRTSDWPSIAGLPNEEQRRRLEAIKAASQADPLGGRTPQDEQAMETQANEGTGEDNQSDAEGVPV